MTDMSEEDKGDKELIEVMERDAFKVDKEETMDL